MLEVKNIVKSFGRNKVLNKISFKVNKGDIVSVIGPSGSGKSTLLRCINHLEEPNSGLMVRKLLRGILLRLEKRLVWYFSNLICSQICLF